jgi:hypothetical protein
MTGDQFNDAELNNIDAAIDAVVAELGQPKKEEAPPRTPGTNKRLPQELLDMLALTGDRPGGRVSRSELLWAFINKALQRGIDEEAIIDACLDPAYAGGSIGQHVLDEGGTAAYVKRQIEHAINAMPATAENAKTIIRVRGGDTDQLWRETEKALQLAQCPVYVRSGVLVMPLWRWQKTAEPGREVVTMRLMPMRHSQLSDMVQHHAAIFQKYNAHLKVWKNIDPPSAVIHALIDAGHWGFPDLVGIVNTPTMRPDGSLLTEPGYDPVTQLWYKPGRDVVPAVPERPTKAEALAARQVLNELLTNFPFADDKEVSRSVAMAGILTTVLRGQFRAAPLFLVLAPEPGTGKTYLCKLIATIATGREVSGSTGAENTEEMEKRLTADAMEAPAILHLNNISFDLESALLSEMVSENAVNIRPLGKTERVPCDCSAMTVFVNGNNIRVIGELVRRTLTCRLDAKTAAQKAAPLILILLRW